MFQRALVVFDNETISPQALVYARELAKRLDAELTFLALVEMAFSERSSLEAKRVALVDLEARLAPRLADISAEFLKAGRSVNLACRVGEPAQELLKFLAERPPFQAIIWGSGEDLPESGGGRRGHWLSRVAGHLDCPIFTLSSKNRAGRGEDRAGG
jgi:nucleotide-binding universal stress UspA family protein